MSFIPPILAQPCFLILVTLAVALPVGAQCVAPSFDAGITVDAAGPGPAGRIASGDLNGDGRTDLVIPRSGTNTISVLLGRATGNPSVTLITSVQRPIDVAVGDFNNDGKLDLAVSRSNTVNQVAILLGDGMGGFGPPTDFPASLSQPLVVADFNNDGNADVFLGNSSTDHSEVLLGNGSGGLAAPFFVLIPNNSNALSADFNNDGKKDLATEYDGSGFVSVALGDGTGHFASAISFPIGTPLFGNLATGDLNGDGKIDLVTAGQSDGVSVLLGNGMGSFSAATSVSTGFGTRGVALGDFNADGKMDIGTGGGTIATILLGNGSGTFLPTKTYSLAESIFNMVVGDVNGDTKPDLVTANCASCSSAATILLGDGSGNLRFASTLAGLSPVSIVTGDWNNDAKTDLAVANISHNNVSIYLGNGAGGFSAPTNFAVATQPRSVAKGDINGDQNLDLVTANYSPNTVSILLGDGFGAFGPATTLSMPGFNPDYATLSDFNNDGKLDLAVGYGSANIISILLGNGTGGFGAASNFTVTNGVIQIDVGDFNSDGKVDIAAAAIGGVAVLLGNGNGGFGAATIFATNTTANSIVVSDFNGDGNADLAAGLGNNNQVLLYAGNGLGSFAAPVIFNAFVRPDGLSLADYNGDGNADLAASGTTGKTSVLLGDGLGGFPEIASYLNGGTGTRAVSSGDFNGDGRPDIAVANQGSANVSILMNTCAATPQQLPALSIADVTLTESDSGTINATFHVTLSAASGKTVSVSFYSAAREALKEVDYQSSFGRLMFAPGVTDLTLAVPVIGDTLDEFDEQYNVILALPLNARLSNTSALGTIIDNDPPPTISISDASLPEGNVGTTVAVFTVNLSAASGKPISVAFGTSNQSALAGSDYLAASGGLAFNPGETTKTIGVTVNGDTMNEADETFLVTLSNPVNVSVTRDQAFGTIKNDDTPTLRLSSSTHTVDEGEAFATINIARTGDTSGTATVRYATSDTAGLAACNAVTGKASERCDYVTTIGTVTFAAGETSKNLVIPLIDDVWLEGIETLTITLSSPTGATLLSPSSATVTITDNDTSSGAANPIDGVEFFIRQMYRDILNRQPDSTGLQNWIDTLAPCPNGGFGEPPTSNCDRLHVASGFFQSDEFLNRGYFAFRFYMVSFNQRPTYAQFIPDMAQVGGPKSPAEEEAAKVAYADAFVQRPEFLSRYPGQSGQTLANSLLQTAGLPSGSYNAGSQTNGQILRGIAETSAAFNKFLTEGTVSILYFGFQRRDPDAIGYQNNLDTLNANPNNLRHMIFIFIYSTEYRQRFGPQ